MVTIRLARGGVPKRPIYRIVASQKGTKRDGRFLEILGQYNPNTDPSTVTMKADRVTHWIENGALPTLKVSTLIKKIIPGLLEKRTEAKTAKIQAQRKARKTRAAKAKKK